MQAVTCILNNRHSRWFTFPVGRFAPVVPHTFASGHDVDSDGATDVVARYPLAIHDLNCNGILDGGDIVQVLAPTIAPATDVSPMRFDQEMQEKDFAAIQAAVISASVEAGQLALVD